VFVQFAKVTGKSSFLRQTSGNTSKPGMIMMNSPKILVAEDNKDLIEIERNYLAAEHYEVFLATSGSRAMEILRNEAIDLVLLDLNLGDMDGMEVLKRIRIGGDADIPVIIVSSVSEIDKKLKGFKHGCDDYITKPFYPEELVARVKSTLKRSRYTPPSHLNANISCGIFTAEPVSIVARKNGIQLPTMRNKVFRIFLFFLRNPGQVFTNEQLHERFWDPLEEINVNSIAVHIHELRSIIENDPKKPVHLVTNRGLGYQFNPEGMLQSNRVS